MTPPIGKTVSQEIKEEYYACLDALPQFVWLMQPDGSLVYANQCWRDYRHLLSQHAGEQEGFAHQQRDDCLRVQDRQHTLSHTDALSEREVWLQNLHPEDRERVLAVQRQAVATGEPYAFAYRLRDGRTGAYRWFHSRRVPLRNEAGQIIQWVGTCTDIDEQERTDLQQRNVHGATLTCPPTSAFSQQVHQEVAVQHGTTPFEAELVCKDGSHLPVLMGGVAFHDQVLQGIGFVLDNSVCQELERRNAFLSIAGHELKTPLASLKLQTQLLRKKLEKQNLPNMEVVCAHMETQLNAITRLVDEFLDIARVQAGKLEYAHEMVDLDETLKEVVDVLQQMHTTHTIVVQHASSPALVVGDRDRFVQVFQNVLCNAIKYAPDAPLIDVVLTTSVEAVTISVRDQGIGIPRELQGKIFERFYRAVAPQQRAFPGLGMGLYIVAEIVKHHGGTIRVESETGKGSTFHLTFPLATSREEVSRGREEEERWARANR